MRQMVPEHIHLLVKSIPFFLHTVEDELELVVNVLDANDNPPRFTKDDKHSLDVAVTANAHLGTVVAKLEVLDFILKIYTGIL